MRKREHAVVGGDAAEVAVHGFRRMQEMRGRSGRRKSGGDRLTDQPGLADSGDDHAAFAVGEHAAGDGERLVDAVGDGAQRVGFEAERLPRVLQMKPSRTAESGRSMPASPGCKRTIKRAALCQGVGSAQVEVMTAEE